MNLIFIIAHILLRSLFTRLWFIGIIILVLLLITLLVVHLVSRQKINSLKKQVETNAKKIKATQLRKDKNAIKVNIANSWNEQERLRRELKKDTFDTGDVHVQLEQNLENQKKLYDSLEGKSAELDYHNKSFELSELLEQYRTQKKLKQNGDNHQTTRSKVIYKLRHYPPLFKEKVKGLFPRCEFSNSELDYLYILKQGLTVAEILDLSYFEKKELADLKIQFKEKLGVNHKNMIDLLKNIMDK